MPDTDSATRDAPLPVLPARELASLTRIAQGRHAEVFAWDEGAVVRLLRERGDFDRLPLEVAAMEAARAAGVRVPRLLGTVELDNRPGLVMERIAGKDLLAILKKQPWRVFWSGNVTGEVHARINATTAPAVLPPARGALRRRISTLREHDPALIDFVMATLEGLPDGDALCHGDFHPIQVLLDGEAPVVIDWTNAMRGEPLGDHARTRVLLTSGVVPPGPLPMMALAKVARGRLLVRSYTRAYERRWPIDRARLARWETVHTAARLVEGYAVERRQLLARLRRDRDRR